MDINRREEIIDSFLKLCSRKGLHNTTMQDVAKETGISVGAIYLHFKNKNELIDAFIDRLWRQFNLETSQILGQAASAEKLLHDVMVGNIEYASRQFRQNQGIFDFMNVDVLKYIKKNIKQKRDEFQNQRTEMICQILEKGVREGCFEIEDIPRTAFLFLLALSENIMGPFVLEREHEEIVKDAEDMFALLIKAIKRK